MLSSHWRRARARDLSSADGPGFVVGAPPDGSGEGSGAGSIPPAPGDGSGSSGSVGVRVVVDALSWPDRWLEVSWSAPVGVSCLAGGSSSARAPNPGSPRPSKKAAAITPRRVALLITSSFPVRGTDSPPGSAKRLGIPEALPYKCGNPGSPDPPRRSGGQKALTSAGSRDGTRGSRVARAHRRSGRFLEGGSDGLIHFS